MVLLLTQKPRARKTRLSKVPALKVGASEKQPLTGEVATTTLAGSAQKESQVAWHAEYTPWTCAESILQVTAAGAFDNAQRSIDVNSIEQDSSPARLVEVG